MAGSNRALAPVANNSFRTNAQGDFRGALTAKTSQILSNGVLAGKTIPLPITGTTFYVTASSGPIEIRPHSKSGPGSWAQYTPGTGLDVLEENAFSMLEVRNPNAAAPVVFQMFIGWDQFIDKRLILAIAQTPQVVFPTYPVASAAPNVDIVDLSGQAFTDINGNEWYALYRVAILVSNPDTGVTFNVQHAGSVIAGGPAIISVPPQTAVRLDIAGDYSLNLGGSNINALVSEIYAAIPKTT